MQCSCKPLALSAPLLERELRVVSRRILEVDFGPTILGGFSTTTHVYKRLSELTLFFWVALELHPGGSRTLRDEI